MLDVGMVGTEMLYWTVGSRELDGGLMCTASHNPKAYTGAKLVRRGAIALSGDSGIGELREIVAAGEPGDPVPEPGRIEHDEIGDEFRRAALGYIDPDNVSAMKVVLDGGNGMAGPMVGPLLDSFPIEQVPTYWEPDGEFPDHEPNPLLEENRQFIIDKVREQGADLGIAWDGDADRCFFIDDTGEFVAGDFLTALLAEALLRKEPGATILYDVRASRAVPDLVAEHGGTRPGQPRRARLLQDAHARDRRGLRRRGVRPLLLPRLLLRRLRHDPGAADPRAAVGRGQRLSELLEPLRSRYFISGEINSEVEDQEGKMEESGRALLRRRGGRARRHLGRLRRLALQRAALQHRAAAAAQPRVARLAGAHGGEAGRGAGPDPRLTPALAQSRSPSPARPRRPTQQRPAHRPEVGLSRRRPARAWSGPDVGECRAGRPWRTRWRARPWLAVGASTVNASRGAR